VEIAVRDTIAPFRSGATWVGNKLSAIPQYFAWDFCFAERKSIIKR
jgi:hypothetical protein